MPESFFKRRLKTIGLPPGSLIYTGEKQIERTEISLFHYDAGSCEELKLESIDACEPYLTKSGVCWVNIDGLSDTALMERVGTLFNIHPLLLEDVVSVDQRPKIEQHGDNLLIMLKMLTFDQSSESVLSEHVSILLGGRYVVTFQERPGDVFDSVRERIRKSMGRIRKMGNDFLAYALVDAIVDNYFVILEKIGDRITTIDEQVRERPTVETSHTIGMLKRELNMIRRFVWPVREILHMLSRGEYARIAKSTEIFIRDVYDHTIQIIDAVENLRDLVAGMFDSYLSSISFRMNKIMSVLTIIATIFIPLTFIAGVYGMNFRFMPELGWKYGYPAVLGAMAGIGATMLFIFKRKKWL